MSFGWHVAISVLEIPRHATQHKNSLSMGSATLDAAEFKYDNNVFETTDVLLGGIKEFRCCS